MYHKEDAPELMKEAGLIIMQVRELLMALGLAAFGLHAVWKSDDLFRVSRE